MTTRRERTFSVNNDVGFVPIIRPPKLGKWEAFHLAIWNDEEQEFLGRCASNWAKILTFYFCFYTGLTILFSICFTALMATIDYQRPIYLLDDSLIGSNPGLGFRPISDNVDIDGSLIWYAAANGSSAKWVDRIDSFLEPYRHSGNRDRQVACDYDRPPGRDQVCSVNVEHWSPCNSDNRYSYDNSSLCIFVKLNKIYGWVPSYYEDPAEFPEAMPEEVRELIRRSDNSTVKTVWVSCHGETPVDQEIVGPIEYYPKQGFAGYYFPYLNTPGYLSPLVAVRFANPAKNILINVECRAWAKNIIYSNTKGIREGSVHFEILID